VRGSPRVVRIHVDCLSAKQEKIMTAAIRTIAITLSLAAFVGMLSGCQKEGPAERAGKEIDNTVKKLTQRVDLIDRESHEAAADLAR
jgi:hypothetical protein